MLISELANWQISPSQVGPQFRIFAHNQLVMNQEEITKGKLSFEDFKQQVLADYRQVCESRETSLLGRKEVLTGKAKFGIFGDGKELAQVALSRCIKPGDWRSGYYRDQTIMFATGLATIEQFFAQLYANPDLEHDPFSGGRQMNAHFATRTIDENGNWKNLTESFQSAADASPTACQMARSIGLGLASKVYRENEIAGSGRFSDAGNEVCFVTIGDASTSEGVFWETVNAVGVLQVPVAICVWDDGYGISVPKEYQTTKGSISEALEGFKTNEAGQGIDMYTVNGWDYASLVETFENGVAQMRETHRPALFHVTEVTQPQGHSTSGSHERYKSKERLAWEQEYDCNVQMRQWVLNMGLATEEELTAIEEAAKQVVKDAQKDAWKAFLAPIKEQRDQLKVLLDDLQEQSVNAEAIAALSQELMNNRDVLRRDILSTIKQAMQITRFEDLPARELLYDLKKELEARNADNYNAHLYSQSPYRALNIEPVPAEYDDDAPMINGFEVLNHCFDALLQNNDKVFAFGEDVGKIGDVNQAFAGLQEKHGVNRVFDTGIREATIMGQGIGMALRGLRPIAEIQYLDYLIYGLQPLTDDLATLQYRTRGGQKAPLIIRTRGHRLEGIWHTGSPMGMIINSLRGLNICVPRNMTQAAGMYNLLMEADEPALVVECLNGYRLKEPLPSNIGSFKVSLGQPEVLHEGTDVTIVTYGSCIRIVEQALDRLSAVGISVELVDVQTLLPFDVDHRIVESVKKTNKVLFMDEDVPGGASAYLMQKVLEEQQGYYWLDVAPATLSAQPHRSAYGSDGDYFSKPNADDVFDKVYALMHDIDPESYPALY